ncbi:hypothetical protein A3J02_01485 [Candidatus Azambacteria bacterium RIFCSPLOWO2_02_FULL_46_11]|uniref:Glycosyltransferase subfamily 4-like N-terminal domain-containing protein n=1 Tax=Candidatus Azambacteria bacterium RIFCSPLOWO2_02_FULL_46_11 TaxID=1797300 RepID=A0A1F5CNL9_9BACT|nr:MAG: hypothetical protein A3J02_01485 [Candidatus Azambacteria bacterium RIFCSPLOWO2_02_FULL_46_11]
MKIIIATGIFPPDIGGPATYSETMARELTKRGFEVAVITYADRSKNQEAGIKKQGYGIVRISRIYPKGLRHFVYFWKLLRISRGADVVYAQDLISAGLPALAATKLLRKKFALKIVGDYAWEQHAQRSTTSLKFPISNFQFPNIEEFQKEKYGLRTELLRFLERVVAKKADVIITPSEYLKKLVIGWGVPEDKIKVIYNAYTEQNNKFQAFVPSSGRGVSNFKFQGDVIISVGRLVPWKGFGALIEIMPELFKENPNFKLLIVGEGPQKENLKSQISNLKLNEKVILLGKVSHAELEAYLKMAKMFVLNTAYEGLSHQLLEALAAELPVVTTNVCGNPEVITDGENGILVDFNDKMALKKAVSRLWKDRVLTEKFIQNGKKTLEKFSLEKMIEGTVSVLKL